MTTHRQLDMDIIDLPDDKADEFLDAFVSLVKSYGAMVFGLLKPPQIVVDDDDNSEE